MIVGFCLYFVLQATKEKKKKFILSLVIYILVPEFFAYLYLECIALDQGYEIQQQDQG